MLRCACRWVLLTLFAVLAAGCATRPIPRAYTGEADGHWQGRLALKVHSNPVQAFSAAFDLQGNPQAGLLVFFTPLGNTAARLQWGPDGAQLQTTGDPQRFASLDALTLRTTGAVLPVASLFAWLHGQDLATPGWQVDLQDMPNGRLLAQRLPPEVPADLKITLDQ